MAYSFEQVFAADPANPSNIAQNASILIYQPGDATKTPLVITDPSGGALSNPVPVNANGFGPAFMADIDRVAWEGGGFTGFFTSYEGMKQVALDAKVAAENAGETAGAAAAAVAEAELAARIASGQFKGEPGTNGVNGANVLPTQQAIEQALINDGPAKTALNATVASAARPAINGARTVFDGDSITASYSEGTNMAGAFAMHTALESGGNIVPVFNAAHGGYTSAQLKDLFLSEVIAQAPTLVIMKPGRNDDPDTGLGSTVTFVDFARTECAKIGAELVLLNATPQGTAALTPATPTVNIAATTGGTVEQGTHRYKVTYLNAAGETTPSAAAAVTTANATSRIKLDIPHVSGSYGAKVYKETTVPVTYTNYSFHNSFEYAGLAPTELPGTGGTSAGSRPTDGGRYGTSYWRSTWSVGTTAVSGGTRGAFTREFPALSTITFGESIRPSVQQRIQFAVDWYTTGGAIVGSTQGYTDVLPANTWTDMKWTGTAPATAVKARVTIQAVSGTSGVNWAAGNTLDRDASYATDADVGFFDGDTNGGAWTGTAGSSTSTKTTTGPGPYGLIATINPRSSPGYSYDHVYNQQSPATPGVAPPSSNTTSSPTSRNLQAARLNAWLARYGAKYGLIVVDIYSKLVDAATGMWKTGLTFDGTHPNGEANKIIGQAVAAALAPSLKPAAPLVTASAVDPLNLYTDGLLLAGTDVYPSGSTTTTSPSYQTGNHVQTRAPKTGYVGNAYTLERLGGGSALTTFPVITTGFTAGDRLLFGFVSDTANLKDNGSMAIFRWADQADVTVARYLTATADHGVTPFVFERVIGAGVTSLKFSLELIGKGKVSVGQIFAYNLTTNSYLTP